MVAALVLTGGLLAVVASHRAVQQLTLLGDRTGGAAEVAASRLAALQAAPCATAGATATSGPYTEQWTVAAGGATADVTINVTFVQGNRPHTVRYDATLLCGLP